MITPSILIVSANTYGIPYPAYPLGVSYLKSYLEVDIPTAKVEIWDFNLQNIDQFRQQIQAANYDYICISLRNIDDTNVRARNSFIEWYRTIIESARLNSNARIIIGGAGYSIFPELLFEELRADFAIHGEGEVSLSQLIRALDQGTDYIAIQGLVYRNSAGEIVVNPRTEFSRSMILEVDDRLLPYYWQESGMLNIQTKRGCPHRCIYCSYPLIEGRKVRVLDAEIVVDNLKKLYAKGITYLFFTDSVFNIDKKYNERLARLIIESGIKISWGAYFAPHNLTYDELKLYKESGLTHIEFGTESFSDTQLKNYRKGFTFDDVLESSRLCYDLGIFYAHFLILGGYGETQETLRETFENSKQIQHSIFFPYLGMRIYPKTELCEIALREGIIDNQDQLIDPIYYISQEIDLSTIESQARATGQKWIFPDDQQNSMIERFRAKGRKGLLWEYLRY